MRPSLDDLHKLPVKLIVDFKKSGVSKAIPEHLQQYILQLDKVAEIVNVEGTHNIQRAANKLREYYPDISFSTAKTRIYDAINYFHINSTVKEEAWDNYYADRMEDAAMLALSKANFTEYRRFIERAREYRKEASKSAINPDDFKPHIFLIDPSVSAEMLGIENMNLKQIWSDSEELIDKMPVNSKEKARIKKEAAENLGVEDVDFEEFDDD